MNQTETEYDTIKVLREIMLLFRLNKLRKKYLGDKNDFITNLIDIVTPASEININ